MYFRILIAVALLVATEVKAEKDQTIQVVAVRENHGSKVDTLHCTIQASLEEVISSHADARLSWVLANNTKVTKGQLVAKQDDYYLKKSEAALVLALEKSQANLLWTQQNHQRLADMPEKLVFASQLDETRFKLKQAEIDSRSLQLQLEELRYRLKHLEHYAPLNGEVSSVLSQPGERLVEGQSIVRIVPGDNRELNCRLPLSLFHGSEVLQQANFTLESGEPIAISRVSNLLDEKNQTLPLYLVLPKQGEYLTGQRLRVNMELQSTGVAQVPFDALNLVADGYFVWQFTGSTVNKVQVEVLSTKGSQTLIKSTLVNLDKVVIKGKEGLEPGQQVNAIEVGSE